MMKKITTKGDICLKDEYHLIYRVAGITYTEWEDESFVYEFKPDYSVVGLLDAENFQGIPGLDLELRKDRYVRKNRVPVFISERTPGKNREELWELLKRYDMKYLNQLEWLIRTDMQYSGDNLFVQRPVDKTLRVKDFSVLGNRSAIICRKLLEAICYGGNVITPWLTIDDTNRMSFYELLKGLYITERKYLDSQRDTGIIAAAQKGNYKGRKKVKVDPLVAQGIFADYKEQKINSTSASQKLGISKSTFLRRYHEFVKESE